MRISGPLFPFVLISVLVAAMPAIAHDWYPVECCHSQDCAPVDSVMSKVIEGSNTLPAMVVTTKFGTVIVPGDFPRRESKDNRMHACMREYNGTMHLFCIFVPPGM